MAKDHVLGIDIGGSGIKGAPVDLKAGEFATDRKRIDTPEDSTPDAVAEVVAKIADKFSDDIGKKSPIGITIPSVVHHGTVRSAANIDTSWIGTDAESLFADAVGRNVIVINDADAAGAAEMHYGAGQGNDGTVLVTTLGTGIGTALFLGGELIPNSELGHLQLDEHEDVETWAANSARKDEDLSWEDWAARLQRYYSHVEDLLWPDLIIVGGGVSKKAEKYLPLLHLRAPIVPAHLLNDAGIIGAAWLASHHRS
ncbi:MAG TPA: ROK family protein [Ornithinimicrobium sp.]|uniref:polyphosphate--glucose phosphotransferase n=1 Tax=Ornithinimicrobium sp. TaxID=1977084 RepID=UPI002B484C1B|nr:ROK family protein [Ornithinimicrobium sp.]HKJ12064.1 ROK family protein [Ornithinimicrobium sp.]